MVGTSVGSLTPVTALGSSTMGAFGFTDGSHVFEEAYLSEEHQIPAFADAIT